jgi:Trp operon repressor
MVRINELMEKEMTRKEFLATLGFGVATIMGFSTLLQLLGKKNPLHQHASYGYGGGAYGGHKPRNA